VDGDTLELVGWKRKNFFETLSSSARRLCGERENRSRTPRAEASAERSRSECIGEDAARYFRLPIDRAFAMKGFGSGGDGHAEFPEALAGDDARNGLPEHAEWPTLPGKSAVSRHHGTEPFIANARQSAAGNIAPHLSRCIRCGFAQRCFSSRSPAPVFALNRHNRRALEERVSKKFFRFHPHEFQGVAVHQVALRERHHPAFSLPANGKYQNARASAA